MFCMKKLIKHSLVLFLLMGCASTKERGGRSYYPGLSIITMDDQYDVTGSTLNELRQAIRKNGPKIRGRSWAGETYWDARWSFQYAFRMGQCQMKYVEVKLTINILTPRWQPPANTSRELIEEWDHIIETLKLHEEGHREIAIEAGREIIQALKSLGTFDCNSMQSEANRLAHEIFDKYRGKNQQYDKETRHGRTQGTGRSK